MLWLWLILFIYLFLRQNESRTNDRKEKEENFHNISFYYKQKKERSKQVQFLFVVAKNVICDMFSIVPLCIYFFHVLPDSLERTEKMFMPKAGEWKLPVLCNALWGSHLHSPMKNKKKIFRSMIEKSINWVGVDNRQCNHNHTMPDSFPFKLKPFRKRCLFEFSYCLLNVLLSSSRWSTKLTNQLFTPSCGTNTAETDLKKNVNWVVS